MKKKIAAGLLLAAALIGGCGQNKTVSKENSAVQKESREPEKPKCAVGYNFELQTVSGKKIRLSDFKGKVVVLQFFGTFCPTCRREIPVLNRLYEEYGGKVVVIGMDTDYEGNPPPALKAFVKEEGIKYPVVVVDQKTWMNYPGYFTGSDIIPQTFFIDKNGDVCYYGVGFAPGDEVKYKAAIDKLLHE
ncbi:TlpA family protein disulfide reductase [Desulfurobacterium sp.]